MSHQDALKPNGPSLVVWGCPAVAPPLCPPLPRDRRALKPSEYPHAHASDQVTITVRLRCMACQYKLLCYKPRLPSLLEEARGSYGTGEASGASR
jgi:hypothetical protein